MSTRHYRVTVDGTSLCSWCSGEPSAINLARQKARLTGRLVLVVELVPVYRVVAVVEEEAASMRTLEAIVGLAAVPAPIA
jgi:hypothetical protein